MSDTAEDFLEELAKDKGYQKMLREKQVRRAAFEAILTKDEQPLIKDLRRVGVDVSSVWDLVNTTDAYPAAIPVLTTHLSQEHHPRTREGIVRALSVPESKGIATQALIDEFLAGDSPELDYKWVVGAAIAEAATEDKVNQIVRLAMDKSHGHARHWLPLALHCMPFEQAEPILENMLNDHQLQEQATAMLKKFRRRRK